MHQFSRIVKKVTLLLLTTACDTIIFMTATGHALIGTAIAVTIPNPVLAIPLAFVSHIAADAFPHWDTGWHRRLKPFPRFFAESLTDVIASLLLPFVIVHFFFPGTDLVYLYTIVITAQLLDWITAPYIFLGLKKSPFDLPYKFQIMFDNPIGPPWGIIGQTVVVGIILLFAYIYSPLSIRNQTTPPPQEELVVCTMDAMECPDGSYVGRVGPNCEFAPCPGN